MRHPIGMPSALSLHCAKVRLGRELVQAQHQRLPDAHKNMFVKRSKKIMKTQENFRMKHWTLFKVLCAMLLTWSVTVDCSAKPASLSGMISAHASPLTRVTVELRIVESWVLYRHSTTDDRGVFHLGSVEPGRYCLVIRQNGEIMGSAWVDTVHDGRGFRSIDIDNAKSRCAHP